MERPLPTYAEPMLPAIVLLFPWLVHRAFCYVRPSRGHKVFDNNIACLTFDDLPLGNVRARVFLHYLGWYLEPVYNSIEDKYRASYSPGFFRYQTGVWISFQKQTKICLHQISRATV